MKSGLGNEKQNEWKEKRNAVFFFYDIFLWLKHLSGCCILYGGVAVNEAGNMRQHQYVAQPGIKEEAQDEKEEEEQEQKLRI